ncbi:MAG: TIGR02677 family protein [Acidimicrobiaceae bacterium]|nr:TIGR02677 family protein [Acidimicrobiaceae bacterium]
MTSGPEIASSDPRPAPGHDTAGQAEAPARHPESGAGAPDRARLMFRYLAVPEWRDYRTILGVFAGTFFAEFTPEEVAAEPAVVDAGIDPAVVPDRLESLRGWGNLTASSPVGNPPSLEDYYRRRNRYLITRAGQEVFELVEGVLCGVDEITDVQAGRLRDLDRDLRELGEHAAEGFDRASAEELAGKVRSVFDVHERFTTELTQFFADLNQWQSRYDLNADEVQLFAGVLVSYVSEQLAEIERMTRPIARRLDAILPRLPQLLDRLSSGLAARVEDAGLAGSVAVRHLPGNASRDWEHLAEWFVAPAGRTARLDQLTRQAVAAVRTLTANVTRLSRAGLGATSRRSDFLRLARFFDGASTADDAHEIAAAAFGLFSCRRLGTLSGDADDPQPSSTSWQDAPRAVVPLSLRERGDVTQRGRPTPLRDRRRERELIQRDRELRRVSREAAAAELLSCADPGGRIDGAEMSVAGFSMLRDLISRSGHGRDGHSSQRTATESGVRLTISRIEGATTTVKCPEGRLVMRGLAVSVISIEEEASVPPDRSARRGDGAPGVMAMSGAVT